MKLLLALFAFMSPLLGGYTAQWLPKDCNDIYNSDLNKPSGTYMIYPVGENLGFVAYCDMTTSGGRWTVIQRRINGEVNFFRPWVQYKHGFGNAVGEHWFGLEYIYSLTNRSKHELLVEFEDFYQNKMSKRYGSFSVENECGGYRLVISGFSDPNEDDPLRYHNMTKFSTFDRDQDQDPVNCARKHLGGFWYRSCLAANPSGLYTLGGDVNVNIGIVWIIGQQTYNLKSIAMKIRPVVP